MFADSKISDDSKWDEMLNRTYGRISEIALLKEQVNRLYPSPSTPGSTYKTQFQRMGHYVTEGSFTCHNRIVADAYRGKVYTVDYAVPPATHGSDQAGTFFNPLSSQNKALPEAELVSRQGYQSYLVSFARSGNPNTYRNKATTIEWPLATGNDGPSLANVLKVANLGGASGFSLLADDPLQARLRCQYWSDVQKFAEKALAKTT